MNMRPANSRGIALLDSLLALLVVCVGMLSLSSLHLGMTRAGDSLRQRGEATRLAQGIVEQLRVAPGQARAGAPVDYGNTRYSTVSRMQGPQLQVTVAWQDRAGQAQSTELSTQVMGLDTAALAVQAFATSPAPFTTDARNAAIPLGVEKSGPGRSRLAARSLAFSYQVDDASGAVAARCRKADTASEAPRDCEDALAYLVSGFIRFGPGLPASGLALDAEHPLALAAGPQGTPADCSASLEFAWRDPVTGRTQRVPSARAPDAAFSEALDRFIAYTCVVMPVDEDRDAATAPTWTGTLALNPAGWTIGTGPGDYQVQRIGPASQPLTGSADQQNFMITRASTIPTP